MEKQKRSATPRRRERAAAIAGRPYHHGRLRQAIIAAALEEIRQSGPKGLSLRAVAKRTGVSPAAPYRHFRDKEALLAALAEEGFEAMCAQMVAAGAQAADARERLRALGRTYVSFAVQHPEHFRIMFGPELAQLERHPEAHEAAQRTFALLVDAVERCQGEGRTEAGDPRPYALSAWAMAHGLASLAVAGRLPEAEQTVPTSLRLLLSGLMAADRTTKKQNDRKRGDQPAKESEPAAQ